MGNWCWRIELVKLQALLKNRALALHQTAHLYGTNLKLKFCLDFLGMIPCFDYLFVLPQPEMRVRRHLQQPGWSWGLTARSWDLHGHVTDHLSALSTSLGSILRTEGRMSSVYSGEAGQGSREQGSHVVAPWTQGRPGPGIIGAGGVGGEERR